jgi:hypothetical protein
MGNIGVLRRTLIDYISKYTTNIYPGYADVFVKYPAVILDITNARIAEEERYRAEIMVVSESREEADDLVTKIKNELSNKRKGAILILYAGMDNDYRAIGNTLYNIVTLSFTVYWLGGV